MSRCLVLNVDFQPLTVISWKRALVLTIINEEMPGEGAELIEAYSHRKVLSAGGKEFFLPAVIRKLVYVKPLEVPLSKKNLLIRDDCRCQYCWQKFKPSTLTIDHVTPKSFWKAQKIMGNPTNWQNVVIACKKCNAKKANKSLEKCGLDLLEKPVKPPKGSIIGGFLPWIHIPNEWKPYLSHLKYYKNWLEDKR